MIPRLGKPVVHALKALIMSVGQMNEDASRTVQTMLPASVILLRYCWGHVTKPWRLTFFVPVPAFLLAG